MANEILGKASLILSSNSTELEKGLDKSQTRIQGFMAQSKVAVDNGLANIQKFSDVGGELVGGFASKAQGLMTAFATGGIAGALASVAMMVKEGIQSAIEYFEKLEAKGREAIKAANRMGREFSITADAATTLGFAARRAGVEEEGLNAGLNHLARSLGEAQQGSEDARRAFTSLGLDWRLLREMPLDRSLGLVGDALNRLPNASDRATAGMAIFGRGYRELLPILNQGTAGLEATEENLRRLGAILGESDMAEVQRQMQMHRNYEADRQAHELANQMRAVQQRREIMPGYTLGEFGRMHTNTRGFEDAYNIGFNAGREMNQGETGFINNNAMSQAANVSAIMANIANGQLPTSMRQLAIQGQTLEARRAELLVLAEQDPRAAALAEDAQRQLDVLRAFAPIVERLTGTEAERLAQLRAMLETRRAEVEENIRSGAITADQARQFQRANQLLEERIRAQEAAELARRRERDRQVREQIDQQVAAGNAAIDSLADPLQKFQDRLAEIDVWKSMGMDEETANALASQAATAFENAMPHPEEKLGQFLAANSTAARNLVYQATYGAGESNNVQDRMRELLEQANAQRERLATLAQEQVNALTELQAEGAI